MRFKITVIYKSGRVERMLCKNEAAKKETVKAYERIPTVDYVKVEEVA